MLKNLLWASIAFLTLSACGHRVVSVQLADVISNPEAYSEDEIEVQGAAVIQFERYFICPDPASVDVKGVKCVWINANYEVDGFDHIGLLVYDKKILRVVGRFSTARRGHLGQYAGELTPTSIEVLGVHSAGNVQEPERYRGES